jgi:hypothetical protein
MRRHVAPFILIVIDKSILIFYLYSIEYLISGPLLVLKGRQYVIFANKHANGYTSLLDQREVTLRCCFLPISFHVRHGSILQAVVKLGELLRDYRLGKVMRLFNAEALRHVAESSPHTIVVVCVSSACEN